MANNEDYHGSPVAAPEFEALQTLERLIGEKLHVTIERGHVTRLDIVITPLTTLPDVIAQLPFLEGLHLARNKLVVVPEFIGNLASLSYLSLFHNQISSLPASIGKLKRLTYLDLSGNRFTSLPEEIGALTSLEELNLAENALSSLPSSITNLTSLRTLDLTGNSGSWAPETIERLAVLLRRQNSWDIDQLYPILGDVIGAADDLTFIKEITSWANQFRFHVEGEQAIFDEATDWEGWIGALAGAAFMTAQDRQALQFGEREMGERGKSKKVDIQGASPGTSAHARPLLAAEAAVLALLENTIHKKIPAVSKVDEETCGFATAGGYIVALSLPGQGLTSLPREIEKLTLLKELNLARNKLTALPATIGNLKSLITLTLAQNKLLTLPDNIGNLSSLQNLDLRDNELTSLPAALGQLEPFYTLVWVRIRF